MTSEYLVSLDQSAFMNFFIKFLIQMLIYTEKWATFEYGDIKLDNMFSTFEEFIG